MTLFVRATRLVNEKLRFLDQNRKNPELKDIKLDWVYFIGDVTAHANLGIFTRTGGGAVLHMRETVIICVHFYPSSRFL